MPPRMNLTQYIDSGNLDLSMLDIQDIPVNDIAANTSVRSLDLSCNNILILSDKFSTSLKILVKLDLSKNKITNLPANFGLLVNLKHLDLYSNKLEFLPLSFAKLKSLRWLDLKENPLTPKLAEIAGRCHNDQECKEAARNVVAAFCSINEEISRFKEEQLKNLEKNEASVFQDKEDTGNKEKQPKKKNKKNKKTKVIVSNPIQLNGSNDLAEKVVSNLLTKDEQTDDEIMSSGLWASIRRKLRACKDFIVSVLLFFFWVFFVCFIVIVSGIVIYVIMGSNISKIIPNEQWRNIVEAPWRRGYYLEATSNLLRMTLQYCLEYIQVLISTINKGYQTLLNKLNEQVL